MLNTAKPVREDTLAAGALCVRYLRAPIADDIGPQLQRLHADVAPQLRRMENQLDTIEETVHLPWHLRTPS